MLLHISCHALSHIHWPRVIWTKCWVAGGSEVSSQDTRTYCVQALLKSSEIYNEAKNHAAGHGVMIEGVSIDLPKMMEQKDKAVDNLTKGIEFLFKKNKVCPLQWLFQR